MPFIRSGDLDVHYLDRSAGVPVVFIHGNWANGSWWEPLLARLPDGRRGLALDLRGRGRTAGPDSDYSIPALADDLRAFAGALGLGAAHLVGHSLGAAVAMQRALDDPASVRSLSLIAPPWVDGLPEAANFTERQRALKADPAMFALALKALAPTVSDDDSWKRLVAEGHAQRLAAAIGAIDALRDWTPGDRLRSIPRPKLVIGGERDILVTAPVLNRAAEALGARLATMPGVGHCPNIEAPDALLALLLDHWRAA